MKNKAKLAFEMLEMEMEVIDREMMMELKGGELYKYSTNPMTGQIERYHSNSNGMSWFKDYAYNGGQDIDWTGPDYAYYSGGGGANTTNASYDSLPNGYCVFNAYSQLIFGNAEHADELFATFAAAHPELIRRASDGTMMGIITDPSTYNYLASLGGGTIGQTQITDINTLNSKLSGGLSGNQIYAEIVMPEGNLHAVILDSINTDGSYRYFDPTNNVYGNVTAFTYTYEIEKYAYTVDYTTTEGPYTTTEEPYTTTEI